MAFLPIDEVVAAALARRGVYPLTASDCVVPDEWLTLLCQLQAVDGAIQRVDEALNGSPPKRDR